jgi:hypothetical protein
LGGTTYKVDAHHQKVWVWQDPLWPEPNGGWVSLTKRSADPGEKATCEVLDYRNWSCTDSDKDGTVITELVGGLWHLYEYGKPLPGSTFAHAAARCDVQVDELTAIQLMLENWGLRENVQAGEWEGGSHEPSQGWVDCTKAPP